MIGKVSVAGETAHTIMEVRKSHSTLHEHCRTRKARGIMQAGLRTRILRSTSRGWLSLSEG